MRSARYPPRAAPGTVAWPSWLPERGELRGSAWIAFSQAKVSAHQKGFGGHPNLSILKSRVKLRTHTEKTRVPPLCARLYAQRASARLFKQRSARSRQTLEGVESSSEPRPSRLTSLHQAPGSPCSRPRLQGAHQTSKTRTVSGFAVCGTPVAY